MEAVGRTAGTALGGEGRQDSHPDRHHDEEEGEGGDGYAGGDGDQGNIPYRQRLDYHHHNIQRPVTLVCTLSQKHDIG